MSPRDEPAARVGRRVAIAALYAVLQRMVLRGLGFFSTLILVRLLAPNDFGIVAVAGSLYSILDMLTITGFGMALVRMDNPQPQHYHTVYTLTVLRGLIIALLMVAFAGVQADIMGDRRIVPVMWVLALSVLVQSFESIRMIDFERELRFDQLLRYNVIGKVLGILISLPLAIYLQNYWALVLGGPLSRLITVPYSFWLAPYRPRLSIGAWRELLGFSKWLMLGNLCTVVDAQLLNLIVGRLQGMAAVGLYQVGRQIAALPITEIAAPIRAPLYSGFSRIYRDIGELRRHFMSSLELQWVMLLPLSVGICLTSHEVTLVFLGEKWASLVPLMPLIALFELIDSFSVYSQMVFIVLNRQAPMVLSYWILIGLRAAMIVYGAMIHGLEGAAWAMLISGVMNVTVWFIQVAPLLSLRLAAVVGVLWRGAAAASAMSLVVLAVPHNITGQFSVTMWPIAIVLLTKAALGAATYCGSLLVLWLVWGMPSASAESHLVRVALRILTNVMGALPLRRSAS